MGKPMRIASNSKVVAATALASAGFRRHQRQARSTRVTGRTRTGSLSGKQWMWVAYQERLLPDVHQASVGGGRREYPFDAILQGKAPALSADERLWQQAARLVHEALEGGKAEAWFKIGELYRDGSVLTPKQPFMAWSWFAHAAEMNHAPARDAFKSLEASLSPEELTKANRFWVPRMKR
jgi:TPR repeat protein